MCSACKSSVCRSYLSSPSAVRLNPASFNCHSITDITVTYCHRQLSHQRHKLSHITMTEDTKAITVTSCHTVTHSCVTVISLVSLVTVMCAQRYQRYHCHKLSHTAITHHMTKDTRDITVTSCVITASRPVRQPLEPRLSAAAVCRPHFCGGGGVVIFTLSACIRQPGKSIICT